MLLPISNTPRQIGTSIHLSNCAFILHSQPNLRARHQHATIHNFLNSPVQFMTVQRCYSVTALRLTRNDWDFKTHSKSALDSEKSISTITDVSESDIFAYKAQRWLWNEPSQLQRRYLKFNISSLIHAAEKALGPGEKCVNMTKLPEGNFNKTLLVEMQDGREVIAKLPNPNAGRPYYTTASEVATMDYVRNRLNIPVPKVLAYNTQAKSNDVGAEYIIIMEKCGGIELGHVWDELTGKEKTEIVRQLATYSVRLSKAKFPYYGSIYFSRDIPDIKGTEVDDTFSVGPTTSRDWVDDRRGEVDVDRGPWRSPQDVLTATIQRETACLRAFPISPPDRQQSIFNSANSYRSSISRKISVLEDYALVLPFLLSKDPAHTASTLWHTDLHTHNIFVHPSRPTQITSIIDWQCANLSPAFLHITYPSLLDYSGPKLPGLTLPQLPRNFEDMDKEAKKQARELHLAQSLWGLYRIFAMKQDPNLSSVLGYRDTLAGQIMDAAGAVFDDGEVHLQNLLAQLVEPEMWRKVMGQNAPCPLSYSEDELTQLRDALEKWDRHVERKARVLDELGAYEGWDGAVEPGEYDAMAKRLEGARGRFLDGGGKTEWEGGESARVWPFKDG
ncbi:hypothetical protein HBI23_167260 [Parastagonospora nodorum]|nr:hypothetical protein HBI23_167260 [Parastagonospora nodorum]